MTLPGRFIVIEGLEGAGKTTALATIKNYLQPRVSGLVLTREPGGTLLGEVLRSIIKEKHTEEPLQDISELLLMYASRVQLLETVIRPALLRGEWVISDRFEVSTYAYQGGGRGIDKTHIRALSQICLNGFQPDCIFYLDISPALGLERARLRSETDRIESESLAFFQRVHSAYYEALADYQQVQTIDASKPLAVVQNEIMALLTQLF